ncbi:hypothetical protein [Amycolatopsis sp. NPDC001319]
MNIHNLITPILLVALLVVLLVLKLTVWRKPKQPSYPPQPGPQQQYPGQLPFSSQQP